jgi:H+-translocating NAD(P) transhydrogenase subunit alpha
VDEVALCHADQLLICFVFPARNQDLLARLAQQRVSLIAMDQVPRITRAQKLDALSSMANIAGYRAVIEAAHEFGRFFTGQITAAGKVAPAKVLVIGAGVAGLSAIGAARALGAVVRAFDTRPAVKEQVESMGAQFLQVHLAEDGTGAGGYAKEMSPEFIAAELALFKKQAAEVDIIITTALIPGKPAPLLLPRDTLQVMKAGSVVVDLAAEGGGNCEATVAGEIVQEHGVTVIGYVDLPSRMAGTASQLYATNLTHLLTELGNAENLRLNLEDEVVNAALVIERGHVRWPRPAQPAAPAAIPAKAAPTSNTSAQPQKPKPASRGRKVPLLLLGVAASLFVLVGVFAPPAFLGHFTVFVLSCFVGWQVVWNVTPALHTPLMSVTNAISGIILLGGMLKISGQPNVAVTALAAAAVLIATINVSGGFLVTQRMLRMFRKGGTRGAH